MSAAQDKIRGLNAKIIISDDFHIWEPIRGKRDKFHMLDDNAMFGEIMNKATRNIKGVNDKAKKVKAEPKNGVYSDPNREVRNDNLAVGGQNKAKETR